MKIPAIQNIVDGRPRHLSIHFTFATQPDRMRRMCHAWCLSTRLWREVKVTARLVCACLC